MNIAILFNLSLILSISIISGFIDRRWHRKTLKGMLLQGGLFGAAAIVGMMHPYVMAPGLIFDGRTIAVSVCTLFFGPLSGFIAGIFAISYRIDLGGSGVIMGSLTVVSAFIIGMIFHRLKLKKPIDWLSAKVLYLFGFAVHTAMMCLVITLPSQFMMQTLITMSFTVLGLYPIFTVLLGKILHDQESIEGYQKEIQTSDLLFRKLFDEHAAVKLIIDPEDGSIVNANIAAANFYGWSREQLVRMRISDINILSAEEIKQEMDRARQKKKIHFEFRHRLADGSVRDVAVFSSAIEIKGRMFLHSIIHDITERKKAEQESLRLQSQLNQAQRMESLGNLAGGIAHDFNNLLTTVIGFAYIIKKKLPEGDRLIEYVDQILEAGRRGASLTSQILTFSRQQPLDIKAVNINEIIINIEGMLRRLLREDINLRLRLSDRELVVLADATQLDQIIINLITNARDAMPSGGALEIATRLFDADKEGEGADIKDRGSYALLTISDTGCGMDKETLSHIFEPFYTTKEVGKGTGLGLAVVYGIVKQHNGHISVYSEPDKGSVFNIYIPLADKESHKLQTQDMPQEIRGGSETILLAEDDESLRMLFSEALKQQGYNVIDACDGEEAVQRFSSHREEIKLVILDGIMPRMNGDEVHRKIKGLSPNIKAIFISGYGEDVFLKMGIFHGDGIFLQKPLHTDLLLRQVRSILDEI